MASFIALCLQFGSVFFNLICHLIVIIHCMLEALSRCKLLECRPALHSRPKLPAHNYRVISDLGITALRTHRGSKGGKSAKRERSLKKFVSLGLINARSINKRAAVIHHFLHSTTVDVLAITEIWFTINHGSDDLGHSARMAILRCTFLAVAAKAVVLRSFIGTRFGWTLPHRTKPSLLLHLSGCLYLSSSTPSQFVSLSSTGLQGAVFRHFLQSSPAFSIF